MLQLPRNVAWLGGLALLAWGCAAVLIGFQMAGDVPTGAGGFVAIVAGTLTVVAVQLGKREAPAVQVEPAPLQMIPPCEEVTVGIVTRARATVQLHPLQAIVPELAGRTYRSGPRPWPTEVPRPRVPIEVATTDGYERGYFKAFNEISEEVLGERNDDPPSGGA